jgi:hypothetical protein
MGRRKSKYYFRPVFASGNGQVKSCPYKILVLPTGQA